MQDSYCRTKFVSGTEEDLEDYSEEVHFLPITCLQGPLIVQYL